MNRAAAAVFQSPIVHPILFSLWPGLALYGQNVARFPPSVLVLPSLLTLSLVGLVLCGFRLIAKGWAKASIMTSILVVAFFDLWKPLIQDRFIYNAGPTKGLVYGLYVILAVLLVTWIYKRHHEFHKETVVANCIAAALLVAPIFQIATGLEFPHRDEVQRSPQNITLDVEAGNDTHPDVFLIILDGYGRADLLKRMFDFDNSPFVDSLKSRGFFVAANSTSNYNTTNWSLPSFLNMDYLDALNVSGKDDAALGRILRDSRVLRLFKSAGYTTYAFPTGFKLSEPGPEVEHIIRSAFGFLELSEFEYALADFNPIPAILRTLGYDFAHEAWRRNILYTLDNLHRPLLESPDAPLYVRAHIVAPHWPFVFREDGSPYRPRRPFTLREQPKTFASIKERTPIAVGQIKGLNRHVLAAIDRILDTATTPPAILLVSDHGPSDGRPGPREMSILCALLLPPPGDEIPRELLDDISLVNLFRVIFNTYFTTDLPLLETRLVGAAEVNRGK